MKNKIVFKSQKDFVKWVTVSNMFDIVNIG